MKTCIASLFVILVLSNARAFSQIIGAEDALVSFISHLDFYEEVDYLVSVSGSSNDVGGNNSAIVGLQDVRGLYVNKGKHGGVFRAWISYLHESASSPIDKSNSLNVPSGIAIRKVKSKGGELVEASVRFFRWDGLNWTDLRYPHKASSGFPKGTLGMLGMYPNIEFFRIDVNQDVYVKILNKLEFEGEKRTSGGDIEASWIYSGGAKGRMKMLFSKSHEWLPIKIALTMPRPNGTEAKVWEGELDWHRHGKRFVQSKTIGRDYFPDGRMRELELSFDWVIESDIPVGAFKELETFGFDAKTDSFDPNVSWIRQVEAIFKVK
jgi:hypothetical protein